MTASSAASSRLFHDAASAVRAGLGWWVGELAGMLPRRLAGRAEDALIVTVPAEGGALVCRTRDGAPAAIQAGRRAATPAVLRLPPDLVLARTVTLAAAAAENLQEVVSFQLDRFTPFEPDEVYLGCRIVGRDADAEAIKVAIAVAPRPDVDRLLADALGRGLACHTVVVASETPDAGLTDDLPLAISPAETASTRSGRATRALWLLALVLAAACVAVPLLRGRAALSETQRELAAMRREAQAVSALRLELEERGEQAAIPIQRMQRTPLSILLAELTRLVPDSGWITQLEIDAGSIQVTGFAAAANALIPALEASPILTSAAFRSPVTQDAVRGVEQFHLSVDLRRRNE